MFYGLVDPTTDYTTGSIASSFTSRWPLGNTLMGVALSTTCGPSVSIAFRNKQLKIW